MIRTLHCGKSTENYELCIDNRVAGFTHRGPQPGDEIYLVVKIGQSSLCGARFILNDVTDEKPWEDSDKYVSCFSVKDIEFCKLFDLNFLKQVGGEYWSLKYLQGAKAFDEKATKAIDEEFKKNKCKERQLLKDSQIDYTENEKDDDDDNSNEFTPEEIKKIEKEVPQEKINIMGTFQTISFKNEVDSFKGLERLVSENFYNLFEQYKKENTILIPQNRYFRTQQGRSESFSGIVSIPDGLLIHFDENQKQPFSIIIIEFECYGESKERSGTKTNYMNSHIIPQLMQFASSFSVITDQKTRDYTISNWIEKIMDATQSEEDENKIDTWLKKINPEIRSRDINSFFEKKLREAFKSSLKVMLIIDELSYEQKQTIGNIISSFKLESGKSVEFKHAVVKLVQKITVLNESNEYALTVQ